MQKLLDKAIKAALTAAVEIMDVYENQDFLVQTKPDDSPLTIADLRAHDTIKQFLEKSNIPILSEEGGDIPYEERARWPRFWLVDPLDGTKEFIKRNGEFTVNIALIESSKAVLGVVYAPVLKQIYYGDIVNGAFTAGEVSPADTPLTIAQRARKLPLAYPGDTLNVVASKSHLNEETRSFIANLEKESTRPVKTLNIGSSLKLCLVAEGKAEIYPRFGPTMEWDTAAGHAVVKAAGKNVRHAETNQELQYNKEDLLNPFFIVR
jgi:3'(2'), 5'-bisphosphate nucleotidase